MLLAAASSAQGAFLGGTFYGLHVLLPYDFLERERAALHLT